MAGREIFKKRHQLRAFTLEDHHAFKTTDYQVTSDFERVPPEPNQPSPHITLPNRASGTTDSSSTSTTTYPKYAVKITASPRPSLRNHASSDYSKQRKHRSAIEANRAAAFGYTKVACLFFVSLLVTWVPSSINRVYSLIYPDTVSVPYAYAAGVVLSLMGFWNSVIYITTTRDACKTLFSALFRRLGCGGRDAAGGDDGGDGVRECGGGTRKSGRGGVSGSWGDSYEELRSGSSGEAV